MLGGAPLKFAEFPNQSPLLTMFQRFWEDLFCHKSCTVHYIVNMISKAGADIVRTDVSTYEIIHIFELRS